MGELLKNLKEIGANVEDVLNRFRGNEMICEKIIRKFPADKSFYDACAAIKAGDDKEAEKKIHTLKGVSSNLGFTPIYEITTDMMTSFRDGKPEDAYLKMSELEKQYETFVKVINQ